METIKWQTKATCGCMLQARVYELGLGWGLGCTLTLSVTESSATVAVCSLWHYTNAILCLLSLLL